MIVKTMRARLGAPVTCIPFRARVLDNSTRVEAIESDTVESTYNAKVAEDAKTETTAV